MTSPGDCQIQGPQPCLETGAGEGGEGQGRGWIIPGTSAQSAQSPHPCSQLLSSNPAEMLWF